MIASPLRRIGLFALVAAIIIAPSMMFGPSASDSHSYNFIWTRQFGAAMAAGDLYPRWLPQSFEGMGSPTFYFYPPIAYWISGAFDALGLSTLQAINGAAFVMLWASGMTMYSWLPAQGTRPVLGAVLYMIAPYHLLDFWTRGALAEFAAFIWFPLIALGIMRLPQRRGMFLLGGSFAALICTHLPVAMLTGIFLIAPLVGYRAWQDRAVILPAMGAGVLALGLAAFYLLPALTLQDRISSTLLWSPYYQPSNWSLLQPQPLYFLAYIPAIGVGMAILALPARSVWSGIALVAAVAALGLIPFLWDIPPLDKAQFPWRLLGVVEFAAVTAFVSYRASPLIIAAGVAFLIPPYILSGQRAIAELKRPVNYTAMARTMPDAPEYLPAGFPLTSVSESDRIADLSPYRALPSADGPIYVQRAGPVTLRRTAFPIWQVVRDGQAVQSTGPLIRFEAQPGRYRVVRVMIWQEVVGGLISLIAAIMALLVSRTSRRL